MIEIWAIAICYYMDGNLKPSRCSLMHSYSFSSSEECDRGKQFLEHGQYNLASGVEQKFYCVHKSFQTWQFGETGK